MGTDGNLFPLCRNTPFKLTFEGSRNKRHSVGSCWCPRAKQSKANIVTKYQIIFLREKFVDFILAAAKETYFRILVEKILPFSLEPKSSAYFFDNFKSQTRMLQSSCVNKWGSD